MDVAVKKRFLKAQAWKVGVGPGEAGKKGVVAGTWGSSSVSCPKKGKRKKRVERPARPKKVKKHAKPTMEVLTLPAFLLGKRPKERGKRGFEGQTTKGTSCLPTSGKRHGAVDDGKKSRRKESSGKQSKGGNRAGGK